MNILEFKESFIEGYLFNDLRSMSTKQDYGALGYPMVVSILAGMELFGRLLSGKDNRSGFVYYWDNFFVKQNQRYSLLGELIYQLVRNGIAHSFITKPGIFITKDEKQGNAITMDESKNIYIDANLLFSEFENSYNSLVKPIFENKRLPQNKTVQMQLDKLMADCHRNSKTEFKNLLSKCDLRGETLNLNRIDSTTRYNTSLSLSTQHISGMTAGGFEATTISQILKKSNKKTDDL